MGNRSRRKPDQQPRDEPLDVARPATWPEDVRVLVHPRRGLPVPLPVLDRVAIWAEMRARFEVSPTRRHVATTTASRMMSETAPVDPADLATEGSIARAVTERVHPETGVCCERPDLIIDHWVATGGCVHAVRAMRAWSEGPNHPAPSVPLIAFTRLATHLAVADVDTYEGARAAGLAPPLPSAYPAETLYGLAYLFPESGLADGMSVSWVAPHVLTAITATSSLAHVASSTRTSFAIEPPLGGKPSIASMLYTWLAVFGVDALGPLATILDRSRASQARAAALVLGRVCSPSSMQLLFERPESEHARSAVAIALERLPEVVVPILLDHLASSSTRGGPFVSLFRGAVTSGSPRVLAAMASLDASRRTVCDGLVDASPRVVSAAPQALSRLDEALSIAAAPRAVSQRPALQLQPFEVVPSMAWPPGCQSTWLALAPPRNPEALEILVRDPETVARLRVAFREDDEDLRKRLTTASLSLEAVDLACLPTPLVRFILSARPAGWYEPRASFRYLAARDELAFLDPLIGFATSRGTHLEVGLDALLPYRDPRVARIAAKARLGKAARPAGTRWLLWHAEVAAIALLPDAVARGKEAEPAREAMRLLSTAGRRSLVIEVAARYGCERQIADMLEEATPIPAVRPSFASLEAGALPRLVDADTSIELDDVRTERVLACLQSAELGEPHERLAAVHRLVTADSRRAFVKALLEAWLAAGSPSEQVWALRSIAWLGESDIVLDLGARIASWARDGHFPRAAASLDVLAHHGSAAALHELHRLSQASRGPGLKRQAAERLDHAAMLLGLTPDDLGDLSVPDLGLDSRSGFDLDYGSRTVRVQLGSSLQPSVRDGDAELAAPPPASPADDPSRHAHAVARWSGFKTSVRRIAREQSRRLEMAMATRRWAPTAFQQHVAIHPILRQLARGLAWGAYDGDHLCSVFRVADEGTLESLADEPFSIDPQTVVGVVHPMEWSTADARRFGEIVTDYRLVQPFQQLGRGTYLLTPAEGSATHVQRWAGVTAKASALHGLLSVGWSHGEIGNHGVYQWLEKRVGGAVLSVAFEPGLGIGSGTGPAQRVLGLGFRGFWHGDAHDRLDRLHAVDISETLRDLRVL